jgi:hypothetical protein
MSSILDDLPGIIGDALGDIFLDAVLTRDVPQVESPPAQPWKRQETEPQTFACKAIPEQYAERYRVDGTIKAGERRVMILANSLATTPVVGDRITVRNETFKVSEIATDPAQAVWVLRASK